MIQIKLQKQLHSSTGAMDLDIDCSITPGTFLSLYGKSGAGKTSILRMVAGLLMADKGRIQVNDLLWYDQDQSIYLRPQQRKVGLVFQDYALFPNMTVEQNLEFARLKEQDPVIIQELIEMVELGDLRHRKPETLSGGQQQRVALARALVQRPQLLLLDEPLSALDNDMRLKLQQYILQLHREFKLTTVLVSHNISEVVKMADQVIHLEQGKVIRRGTPAELFSSEPQGTVLHAQQIDDEIHLIIEVEGKPIKLVIPQDQIKK